MAKAPAFQFYPADYMRDTRILSLQARGAWADVLCIMWFSQDKGRCNADVTQMKHLWGVDEHTVKAILDEFKACNICAFETDCNGNVTLVNRRMVRDEKERQSTKDRVKKFREKKCNGDVTDVKRKRNVLSSSSSSKKKRPIADVPKKETSPNPEVAIFLKYAFDTFQKTFNEKMLVDGGKDSSLIKKMLGTYDLDKLKRLWDTFLKSDDPFIVKAGRTVGVFKTQINKLISGDEGKESNKPLFGLSPEAEAQIRERDEYEAKLKLEREGNEDA